MERREQYDPEDIESLLQERSYDELLEEERAYVLRHLSGREEYEAMRALLGQVREDDRRREPLVADRAVRDHVMAAFRANQRPQWQVWLNSVGQLLWPKEVSAMWRPALAFGSLALLITAGIWVTRNMEGATEGAQVAELKKETQLPEKPVADDAPAQKALVENEVTSPSAPAQASEPFTLTEVMDAPVHAAEAAADEDIAMDRQRESDGTTVAGEMMEEKIVVSDAVAAPAPTVATGALSHVVTEQELSVNMSVVNATGMVRDLETVEVGKRKKEDVATTSTSLVANPELLALLSNGW